MVQLKLYIDIIRVRALGRWGRVKGLRQGGGSHITTYAVEDRGRGSLKQYFDSNFLSKFIFKIHK